ncbi:MAG: lipid A deacylase LpxR family protein [Bacteroidales bacterium]|nr:lipid A deacylase LpxR family protein [Bacteroidales bacterium]
MKQGILHIVLLFSLLLLAGCAKNDPSVPNKTISVQNPDNALKAKQNGKNKPGQTPIIESRFQQNVKVNQNNTSNQQPDPGNTYQYYIPAEHLEKRALISSGKLAQSGGSREKRSGFRNSIKPQEPDFFKTGRTLQEIFINAIFDNDIFDYTDYYYTSGISFEFYHPAISASPLTQLLPGLRNSVNYYGLTLVQNLYTPRKLDTSGVQLGDRPFSAYLTLGHQRISLSTDHRRRLETELTMGVIGPASLGGFAQDVIHTNEPDGWVNQVNNDIILNYSIRFDQGLFSGRNIELAVITGGQAGTLYDNIMAGIYLQLGKMNDRYGSVSQATDHQKPFKNRIRYFFPIDLKNKLIIYDATLQGGMFNRESVYKLDRDQINRYVFTGTASIGLGLGRYSLEAGQVYLTPEFAGGRHHFWFRIKNIYYIN